MTAFSYRAIAADGTAAKGLIEADSAQDARRRLRARALVPLQMQEITRQGKHRQGSRLGLRHLAVLTRQLATLLHHGVRIEDALQTVADQNGIRQASEICYSLRASVLEGARLSSALAEFPAVFDTFYGASVRAGEDSGELPHVLLHLASHLEERAKITRAVQLALLYPMLLAVVSVAIIAALLIFVVPDIVAAFTARGADLPPLTKALIWISDTIRAQGPYIAAVAVGAVILIGQLLRRDRPRAMWHRVLATARVTRPLTLKTAAAQFCTTLALLLQSGVHLADALGSATGTVTNAHVRKGLHTAEQQVREGAPLSTALGHTGFFSPMLIVMIASGEQSGALAQSMHRSATDQSAELRATVSALVGLAEPLILLVMGGVVMLLVMAILLPIINLNTLVG